MCSKSDAVGQPPRPIAFFHSPKTGGSSVNVTFRRLFGASGAGIFTDLHYEFTPATLPADSADRPPLFMSGHLSPLLFRTNGDAVMATIVRNPQDHLVSYFCYSYKTRFHYPEHLRFMRTCTGYRERRFSAADVARWFATTTKGNPQTKFLSGRSPTATADLNLLSRARTAVDKCDVVGTTDRLQLFLMMLGRTAGLDIHRSWRANTSPRRIIDDAPETLERYLRPYIEYDADIYAYVKERNDASPDWRATEKLTPIPVEAFRPTIAERVKSLALSSPVQHSARMRRGVSRLIDRVGDFKVSSP